MLTLLQVRNILESTAVDLGQPVGTRNTGGEKSTPTELCSIPHKIRDLTKQ
ncbi:MAG: hypothetical protein ACMUIU_07270 [bacterium]